MQINARLTLNTAMNRLSSWAAGGGENVREKIKSKNWETTDRHFACKYQVAKWVESSYITWNKRLATCQSRFFRLEPYFLQRSAKESKKKKGKRNKRAPVSLCCSRLLFASCVTTRRAARAFHLYGPITALAPGWQNFFPSPKRKIVKKDNDTKTERERRKLSTHSNEYSSSRRSKTAYERKRDE